MVVLNKIYTRTGDDGTTALGTGGRRKKYDLRIAAYGTVDETNAAIGIARLHTAGDAALDAALARIQNDLFDVGADLCTPLTTAVPKYPPLRVTQAYVDDLEAACDRYNAALTPLRSFILPGGTPASAYLHVARTVARRAERVVWAAIQAYGTEPEGGVNPLTARYLNRLSDLLFILCRHANLATGDVLWTPGGGRSADPTTA